MCGKRMRLSGSLEELLYREDLLCAECRSGWIRSRKRYRLQGISVCALWKYNDAYSSALLQLKECGDEALKDVFLYPFQRRLKRIYRSRVILPMPSSRTKFQKRGFHHLELMTECLGLPVLDCFEKQTEEDQQNKSYAARQKMCSAIRLKENAVIPERVLLFDDVLTTGATLKGALSCLDCTKTDIAICVGAIAEQTDRHPLS